MAVAVRDTPAPPLTRWRHAIISLRCSARVAGCGRRAISSSPDRRCAAGRRAPRVANAPRPFAARRDRAIFPARWCGAASRRNGIDIGEAIAATDQHRATAPPMTVPVRLDHSPSTAAYRAKPAISLTRMSVKILPGPSSVARSGAAAPVHNMFVPDCAVAAKPPVSNAPDLSRSRSRDGCLKAAVRRPANEASASGLDWPPI